MFAFAPKPDPTSPFAAAKQAVGKSGMPPLLDRGPRGFKSHRPDQKAVKGDNAETAKVVNGNRIEGTARNT